MSCVRCRGVVRNGRCVDCGLKATAKPAKVTIVPDSSWKKGNIKEWLDAKGVEYTSSMTKDELLELV